MALPEDERYVAEEAPFFSGDDSYEDVGPANAAAGDPAFTDPVPPDRLPADPLPADRLPREQESGEQAPDSAILGDPAVAMLMEVFPGRILSVEARGDEADQDGVAGGDELLATAASEEPDEGSNADPETD